MQDALAQLIIMREFIELSSMMKENFPIAGDYAAFHHILPRLHLPCAQGFTRIEVAGVEQHLRHR
jgi:hypothetical protein